jgi:CheY-like chemotaxis protein
MRTLVAEAIDATVAAARDKPISIRYVLPDEVPGWLRGDANRLRQVLLNLLHNALKFTERGSIELVVALQERGPTQVRLSFEVRDTGVGIADDKLASVFDAFMQADASSTRRHGGSGLGLAIVKELVEAMGGSVSVRSRLGEGSAFRIELPLGLGAPVPDASGPALPLARPGPRPTVLVAEDDAVNQLIVREMLVQLGCDAEIVDDGAAAVECACRSHYDLVLMDLHMPGLDGCEATRRIRQRLRAERLPIVALTANVLPSDREQCLDAGMDDFVTKPVSLAQLGAVIRRWTAQQSVEAPWQHTPDGASRGAGGRPPSRSS